MQGGDISNESPPRFIVVWDVLAVLPEESVKAERKAVKQGRYDHAVRYWEIDRYTVGWMHLAETRMGIRWEVAAFDLGREYCFAVEELLDAEAIGVAKVTPYLGPIALKDSLAYRSEVMAVVDIPSRGLYYGRHTLDPRSI